MEPEACRKWSLINRGIIPFIHQPAVVPTGGPDWQLRLQLTLLFPKSN